jgi:hypothetical protein
MRFTKKKESIWHGQKPLPDEINTRGITPELSEFELLSTIAILHGLTAFDIVVGAAEGTEKDRDIMEVLTAFQDYMAPKMPLSHYSSKDKKIVKEIK